MSGCTQEKINPVFAHNRGENTRSFCVYTVYDNRTDFPIIVDGEARECAKVMGISIASFYPAVVRAKSGAIKRWHIEKRYLDGRKEYSGWANKNE